MKAGVLRGEIHRAAPALHALVAAFPERSFPSKCLECPDVRGEDILVMFGCAPLRSIPRAVRASRGATLLGPALRHVYEPAPADRTVPKASEASRLDQLA